VEAFVGGLRDLRKKVWRLVLDQKKTGEEIDQKNTFSKGDDIRTRPEDKRLWKDQEGHFLRSRDRLKCQFLRLGTFELGRSMRLKSRGERRGGARTPGNLVTRTLGGEI